MRRPGGTIPILLLVWVIGLPIDLAHGRELPRPRPPTKAKPKPTLVMIAARDQPHSARAVQAMQGQLSDVAVTLRVDWIAEFSARLRQQVHIARQHVSKGVLGVFWCDLGRDPRIVLYIAKQNRVLVRSVKDTAAGGRLEAMAIIVRTSVHALLAGKTIGVKAPPPPKPRRRVRRPPPRRPPPPKPVAPGPRRFWLGLEAAYVFDVWGSRLADAAGALETSFTHGAYLTAVLHVHRQWSLLLSYRVAQRVTTRAAPGGTQVTTRFDRYPVGLGARWRWRFGRLEVGALVTLQLEYVRYTYESSLPTSTDRGDLIYSAVPLAYFGVCFATRFRAWLAAGARFPFNKRRYWVAQGTADEERILDPWWVQPTILVGLAVDLY